MPNQPPPPKDDIEKAFEEFSEQVRLAAVSLNQERLAMERDFVADLTPAGRKNIPGQPEKSGGGKPTIKAYEDALEKLKGLTENRTKNNNGQHVYNPNLKRGSSKTLAIRALEVELVHPAVDEDGNSTEIDPATNMKIPEWWITGVVVRGLISDKDWDGNQELTYSSKSSSSKAPPPS